MRIDPTGTHGPTKGQARGPHWRGTGSGFYVPAGVSDAVPEQRIVEAATLLPPGGAVTGWAALRLRQGNFFDGLARDGVTRRPVPLNLTPHESRRDREGISWSHDRMGPDAWSMVCGVPCATAERALFDEMRWAPDERDAAVAMDMAAAAELSCISFMRTFVDAHAGWRGVPLVRRALDLASEKSRSPRETDFQLIWVLDAKLCRPVVNQEVFDRRTGRLLGIADLLDPVAGVIGEFDGGEHAGIGRRSRDAARDEAFRNHKIETFRVTGLDLHRPRMVAERMIRARRRAAWLPEAERTWTLEGPAGWEPDPSLEMVLVARRMVRESHDEWLREELARRVAEG